MAEYKKNKNYGFVYGDSLKVPRGRVCWVHLVKPREYDGELKEGEERKPRFEVTFLLPKGDKDVKLFKKALEVMVPKMLAVYNKGAKAKLAPIDEVLADGDDTEKFKEETCEHCRGNYVMQGRLTPNERTPKVITCDSKKEDIDPSKISGGNICSGIVTPMLTSHGLSFKCTIVQFIKDDGVIIGSDPNKARDLLDSHDDGDEVDTSSDSSVEESEEDEDDTEEDTPAPRKKTKKVVEEEDEEDEDEDEDEEDTEEEEPAPAPAKKKKNLQPSVEDL